MTSKRRREPKAEDEIVPSGLALQTVSQRLRQCLRLPAGMFATLPVASH